MTRKERMLAFSTTSRWITHPIVCLPMCLRTGGSDRPGLRPRWSSTGRVRTPF